MISFLSGILVEKTAPFLVIDVNGVGYEVQASLTTFSVLPKTGEAVRLLTHFVVREDAQLLYGFADAAERQLFRTLIKVNGVGPKLALAILSGMDAASFSRCVLAGDVVALTRLPGVGKKTAERLIVEMKDRLREWHLETPSLLNEAGDDHSGGVSQSVMLAEAENALIALGYKPVEASKALAKLDLSTIDSSEDAIRAALQTMLKR
ncbi:MAG: Holliday junction branch migration protein RuvA [Pseudomonadales bacterium]|nr:Holliday junction branch migration protein RuvA [Pseudomonadales bacterium]MDG2036238.1 Holliday junction branch migration protein RuvA [Pseudomonadales bacterium]